MSLPAPTGSYRCKAVDHASSERYLLVASLRLSKEEDASCKNVLGEIDADEDNGHGLPFSDKLMRFATHRGTRRRLPLRGQFGTGKSLAFIRRFQPE